jgi:hypothetical protein
MNYGKIKSNECRQQSSSLFLEIIKRRVPPHSSARKKTEDSMGMLYKKPRMRSSFLTANGTVVGSRFQRKRENALWGK